MEKHLLVKMLMVSLRISGKQKIVAAQVIRQFARWMDIFLIIKTGISCAIWREWDINTFIIVLVASGCKCICEV